MPDAHETVRADPAAPPAPAMPASRFGWLFPAVRVVLVLLTGVVVWYIAGHWNRWTGAVRFATTNDAYTAGDVTPLAAKVSGYIGSVAVGDYQPVRKGDLIVEIEPSDYRAQLIQATANQAASQAALANLANQKDVQRALIRQAEATIQATDADLLRYTLESKRQRDLLQTRIAGTQQLVEQADANAARTAAQKMLNEAQLDQQKALLASLDVQQNQLQAQVAAAQAQVMLAQNNLAYTRILCAGGRAGRPAPGAPRPVRQCRHAGDHRRAAAEHLGHRQLQGDADDQRAHRPAGTRHRRCVPGLKLTGHVDSWSPGTGSTFALLPPDNATGNFTKVVQRVPVKIVLDQNASLGALVRPGMSVEATIDTGVPAPRARHRRERRPPVQVAAAPSRRSPPHGTRAACAASPEARDPLLGRCDSLRPYIGILGVLIGSIISTLAGRITTFGLADLRGGLHAGFDEGAWITTSFGIGQMLAGVACPYLGAIFGVRRVLLLRHRC